MRIIKKVAVKHVLTERMREKMKTDFLRDQQRLEKEMEQLRFQMQKQMKAVDTAKKKADVRERYHKEIDKRKEKLNSTDLRAAQLDQLPLGTELNAGELDAIEDVFEGDIWPSIRQEVVVKDGRILEIRENRSDDDHGMV